MKYLIILKGEVEGCDYTLGCNTSLDEVEAESPEDAYKKWWDDNFEGCNPYYYCEAYGVKQVTVVKRLDMRVFDFEKQARDINDSLERKKRKIEQDLVLKQAEEIKQGRVNNT